MKSRYKYIFLLSLIFALTILSVCIISCREDEPIAILVANLDDSAYIRVGDKLDSVKLNLGVYVSYPQHGLIKSIKRNQYELQGDLVEGECILTVVHYCFYVDEVITANVTVTVHPRDPSYKLEFTLNAQGDGYIVTGLGEETDKYIVIPDNYNNLPVVEIGEGAFKYLNDNPLYGIEIPGSVKKIGTNALDSSGIESIALSEGLVEIGDRGLWGNPLAELNLPSTLRKIGNYSLAGCDIKRLVIPEGVTYIGDEAFSSSTLEELVIGSYARLSERAIAGCRNLRSVTIKNSSYRVEGNCIIDVSAKKIIGGYGEIEIPKDDGVNAIGDHVMEYSGITNRCLVVPGNIKTIGRWAFNGNNFEQVIICNGVERIEEFAFSSTNELREVTLPTSLVYMGREAFSPSRYLSKVNIPYGLKELSPMVFAGASLTEVAIPGNVKSIMGQAFRGCSLTSVTISIGVEYIGSQAFMHTPLEEIKYLGTVEQWNSIRKADDWNDLTFMLKRVVCNNGVVEISR